MTIPTPTERMDNLINTIQFAKIQAETIVSFCDTYLQEDTPSLEALYWNLRNLRNQFQDAAYYTENQRAKEHEYQLEEEDALQEDAEEDARRMLSDYLAGYGRRTIN